MSTTSHQPPIFVFKGHRFDFRRGRATFYYRAPSGRHFAEKVTFKLPEDGFPRSRMALLNRALDLAMFIVGVSYYKACPTVEVRSKRPISPSLARLLDAVYQDGLSQFAFENQLGRQDLAHFRSTDTQHYWRPLAYDGVGVISLQSGGKDSLLTAQLLTVAKRPFRPVYVDSSQGNHSTHPHVLEHLGKPLIVISRRLDLKSLRRAQGPRAADSGARTPALTGHVPITYINFAFALIQAILLGYNEVLAGLADEGEAPHATIGDLEVRHQWAKTQAAEDLLNDFLHAEVSPALSVGSLLRGQRELDIAGAFVEKCWAKYGHSFSSCNVANYRQRHNPSTLKWCGHCAKCANAFLLFAPFLPAGELITTIGAGHDLFADPSLTDIYKGLLGIDGVMRPFECIGEVDELREAYHRKSPGLADLPFEVPTNGRA